VETRSYLLVGDSSSITGLNRGWLEFKTDYLNYGGQLAFDLLVPYDTVSIATLHRGVEVSRLALWFGNESARIITGKQNLYWGVGRVFRPLDIFNQTNYFEPGYERPGTNALLGFLSGERHNSLRVFFLPQYSIGRSFSGLRFGSNVMKQDIGVDLFYRHTQRELILGTELIGEWGAGYWVEYNYTALDTCDFSKFTVGFDYTLPFRIYVMAEYFFDGSGADDPSLYNYRDYYAGERITLGEQYLYISISRLPSILNAPKLSLNGIINLIDYGFITMPQLSATLFDNAEITFGYYLLVGSSDSEFKNISSFNQAVYIWARVYF